MSRRAALQWGLQLAVSLALLGGIVWWTGAAALWRAIRGAEPRWVLAAAGVFTLVTLVHGVRWWVLLRPLGRVSLRDAVLVLLVAKAVGKLLPLRAGAVLQVQLLGRRYALNRAAVAGTLVLEAVIDAACFLVVFLLLAPLIGGGAYLTTGIWVMALVVIAALAASLWLARRRAARAGVPLRVGLSGRLSGLLDDARAGFQAVRSPTAIALAAALTLGDWLLAALGFWCAGRAFHLDLAPPVYLLAEVVSNLTGAIPFTQSGIGPYEVALAQLMAVRGVAPDVAGAYAVGTHALMLLTALVSAALALIPLRLRLSEVLYLRAEDEVPKDQSRGSPASSSGEGVCPTTSCDR